MRDEAKVKEIQKKLKSEKVRKLFDERNDVVLPAYPSAQWWLKSTQAEKDELMEAVKLSGNNWDGFEMEMKAHWPDKKRESPSYKERS